MNRLSYELTALQNEAPKAAILYSVPSMAYADDYLETVDKAYEALIFNGQKVAFASETQAQQGELTRYKLLIVPNATHVQPATLAVIRSFAKAGGAIVVIGEGSLNRDDNDKPSNASDRGYVLSKAETLPASADSAAMKLRIRQRSS